LRKEPEKRYASAEDLAADLRRWQEGAPIQARPVGWMERSVKWVRRNPRVAALLGLVVLALSGGTLGIYLKYCDAQKQEALARTNEALATSRAEDLEKALAERNSALGSAQSEREKAEKLAQERAVALADVQKEKAKVQNEKNHAEEERDRAKFVAYAFRLREAQGEIERGRLGQARAVLETCDPKLCLWEHEY